jgi:hypothetical protein
METETNDLELEIVSTREERTGMIDIDAELG